MAEKFNEIFDKVLFFIDDDDFIIIFLDTSVVGLCTSLPK